MASQTHDRPKVSTVLPYLMRRLWRGRAARVGLAAIATTVLVVSTAVADEVKLADGDVLHGTVVEQTEDHVVLEHRVLGRLTIPRDEIVSLVVGAPPAATPGDRGMPLEAGGKEPKPKEDKGWKVHVDLALFASAGKSDEQTLRLGGEVNRDTVDRRFELDIAYYLAVTEGEKTDSELSTGVRHDWLIPDSRWFYFAQGRYDYDEFESWEHRVAAHVGPGYNLIERDALKLNVRAGMGTRREVGSENDDWKPEAIVGGNLKWQLSARQSIKFGASFFPVVDDVDDYRSRTTGNWRLQIAEEPTLSLNVGFSHEYQSVVNSGDEKNNLKVFAGVGFDL